MDRKRLLVSSAVLIVLAVLVYLQFRTWKNFDWARFFEYRPDWHHIVHGIILITLRIFSVRFAGKFSSDPCASALPSLA